jgi:hypothetical protein
METHTKKRLAVTGALVVVLLILLGIQTIGQAAVPAGPRILVPDGISHRMTPDEVIAKAQAKMTEMEGVVRGVGLTPAASVVTQVVMARGGDMMDIEPRQAGLAARDPSHVYWVVRGTGTFINQHVRSLTPATAGSGYFVFDDETGNPIGYGMP